MKKDIFGVKIKIIKSDLPEDTDGEYCPATKTIKINSIIKDNNLLKETILHEQIHALFDIMGFSLVLKDEIEELIVHHISSWIVKNYDIRDLEKNDKL